MRLLTSLFLFLVFPVFLQAQFNLSGKISNSSGVSFSYCKLILVKDSVAIQTSDTDTLGNYQFGNLSGGRYELHVKVPFKSVDTAIAISESTTFNLTIDDESYIDDIVISVKQPMLIRKVDRTIFDPANIPVLMGGDAADVIEFAPGVYLSDDNIQVAGGGTAQVMLNDKLIPLSGSQLVSFIRSIPTEDIQYIEIIPVPPVKYASSQGSLINIKLVLGAKSKQSKGSISLDAGQHFYSQQGASGNYSYRSGKFSLYANVSADNSKYRFTGSSEIEYDTLLWDEQTRQVYESRFLTGSLGLNYELNRTTEIGILAMIDNYSSQNADKNFIEKTGNSGSLFEKIENQSATKRNSLQTAVNMNLTKRLDTVGRKLDFNVDYTNFDRNGRINFETRSRSNAYDSLSSTRNQTITLANFISGGIDYVHPMNKAMLSFGARYSYSENTSDLAVYNNLSNSNVADTSQSNVFNYSEQIQALYVSVDWKVKSWSFQVGLRGENTGYLANSPTAELTVKRTYFQLIPKVFAMYQSEKDQTWNFTYSRNFMRPYYSYLNPFRYYTSAYSYTTGNPYLQPVVMHDLSISTNIHALQFYLSFGYLDQMQTDVTIYDNATQTQQTTVSNLFSARSVNFSLSYDKQIKKRTYLEIYASCMLMNRKVTSTIDAQDLLNFSGYTSFSYRYALDKNQSFFFSASMSYLSPYFEQISLTTINPWLSFELKKNMLNNRISLEFSCRDPFKWQTRSSTTISNTTVVSKSNYFDSQGVRFSFTYKFGNNRLNISEHSTNSTGEAGRIGN